MNAGLVDQSCTNIFDSKLLFFKAHGSPDDTGYQPCNPMGGQRGMAPCGPMGCVPLWGMALWGVAPWGPMGRGLVGRGPVGRGLMWPHVAWPCVAPWGPSFSNNEEKASPAKPT